MTIAECKEENLQISFQLCIIIVKVFHSSNAIIIISLWILIVFSFKYQTTNISSSCNEHFNYVSSVKRNNYYYYYQSNAQRISVISVKISKFIILFDTCRWVCLLLMFVNVENEFRFDSYNFVIYSSLIFIIFSNICTYCSLKRCKTNKLPLYLCIQNEWKP